MDVASVTPDLKSAAPQQMDASRRLVQAALAGSEPPRLVLEGGYGLMVWLQEVPDGR
jgi:hypothetical protein